MPTEFELSIINHAVTSGRDANCFFQSFIHTLTAQPQSTLEAMMKSYPDSIKAFVDTFNDQLSLASPLNFLEIMNISSLLHPLERECIFGPILRHTHNLMIDRNLLQSERLQHHPDAIVLAGQTVAFANAFGAKYTVYMSEDQFERSIRGGMPESVAVTVRQTKFQINDRYFYYDLPVQPYFSDGSELFNIDIIYADKHLNYTLGTCQANNNHRRLVVTQSTGTTDGIFVTRAVSDKSAPLAATDLNQSDRYQALCKRFNSLRAKAKVGRDFITRHYESPPNYKPSDFKLKRS